MIFVKILSGTFSGFFQDRCQDSFETLPVRDSSKDFLESRFFQHCCEICQDSIRIFVRILSGSLSGFFQDSRPNFLSDPAVVLGV